MTNTTSLDLLLKEIKDPHVQENFYRLKLYLEQLSVGNTTIVAPAAGGGTTGGTSATGSLTKTMGCASTVKVGDWVYQSNSTNNFAVSATDNDPLVPVIGIVTSKPVPTQAIVTLVGVVDFSIARGRLFLGNTGLAALTAPSSGYLQKLGISFGDGTIFVNPETTRIRRI